MAALQQWAYEYAALEANETWRVGFTLCGLTLRERFDQAIGWQPQQMPAGTDSTSSAAARSKLARPAAHRSPQVGRGRKLQAPTYHRDTASFTLRRKVDLQVDKHWCSDRCRLGGGE